jgi:translation initiation factor IF-2
VVIKADVKGSLEAVTDSLNSIKSDKVKLNIVGGSVGLINPSDVELASTTHSLIVAFNTRSENGVAALLKHDSVGLISHNIIYELVDQVREAMSDLLDPIPQENSLGKAEIRQVFNLSKGTIAGCMVTSGSIFRDRLARLWRADKEIATGKVSHLKRMKDDATEVKSGYECGIALSGAANDFAEGDIIECYEIRMVKQSL